MPTLSLGPAYDDCNGRRVVPAPTAKGEAIHPSRPATSEHSAKGRQEQVRWENPFMTESDAFVRACEYYGRKVQEHLSRTKLCHDLSLEAASHHLGESTSGSSEVADLIRKSVAGDAAMSTQERIVRALTETHFLSLKVNFEFFLYRLVTCNWLHRFEEIVDNNRGRWRWRGTKCNSLT